MELTDAQYKALDRLYESRFGLFGDEKVPISLRLLAMFMGIPDAEAEKELQPLAREGLIRELSSEPFVRRKFYKITDKGIEEFEYARRRHAPA